MKLTYQQRYGQPRKRFAHKNRNDDAQIRRLSALERLKTQLEAGVKVLGTRQLGQLNVDEYLRILENNCTVPLTEQDKSRIKVEIAILESKVN